TVSQSEYEEEARKHSPLSRKTTVFTKAQFIAKMRERAEPRASNFQASLYGFRSKYLFFATFGEPSSGYHRDTFENDVRGRPTKQTWIYRCSDGRLLLNVELSLWFMVEGVREIR